MLRQTEPNANNALGDLLRGMMPGCEVRSQNTQTFSDYPGRHADVLIAAPGRSPVVVEGEYEPAAEWRETPPNGWDFACRANPERSKPP